MVLGLALYGIGQDSRRLSSSSSYQGVIAFTVNLGNVSETSTPVLAAFGYVRDPSIEYAVANVTNTLRPYYTSQYSDVPEMVCYTM